MVVYLHVRNKPRGESPNTSGFPQLTVCTSTSTLLRHSTGAHGRTGQRHKTLRMRGISWALGAVITSDSLAPIGHDQITQSPPESLERSLGLVVRHLVPGIVHAQKGKLAVLAHFAVLLAVNDEGGVAGRRKSFHVGVVERKAEGFAAEPVADVVGVAVDEGHADAVVEDRFEVFFEVRVDEVAGDLEALADLPGRRAGVIEVYAESVLNRGGV